MPDQAVAVEPEGRAGQAGLQFAEQLGAGALLQALAVTGQPVGRQAAQGGEAFAIAGRQAVDRQPQQRARQAQGAQVGDVVAQPVGAQRPGLVLQLAQALLGLLVVVRRVAGYGRWVLGGREVD
ncbi:hypothetical protein D9M69_346060 [compost metagenome]